MSLEIYLMRALKTLLATAALATAMLASTAQAVVLFSDNFEELSPTVHANGQYDTNFTAFTTGLHVEDGTVDLIGPGNPWALTGATNFVDLDGSTRNGGILRTDAFAFNAGDVITFEFDLAGNQRHGTDQWDFGFQTADSNNIQFLNIVRTGLLELGPGPSAFGPAIGAGNAALANTSAWNHYSLSFTAGNSGSFTAYVGTASADKLGPLVDNLLLTSIPGLASVPEPTTWLLMILGFGGVGAMMRRQRLVPAYA